MGWARYVAVGVCALRIVGDRRSVYSVRHRSLGVGGTRCRTRAVLRMDQGMTGTALG